MTGHAWCESCLVGDVTNCEKEVEWRSSANSLSIIIVSGEVPGELIEVTPYRKVINCIRSQICKEQAELIKEH